MGEPVIVLTGVCPRCGDEGEIVMSAEDAEYGETMAWAGMPIAEAYPCLSLSDRRQMDTGIHSACNLTMVD